MTADLLLDCRDVVGESIIWDDRSGELVWVDIGGRRIHRLDLVSGRHRINIPPERPTSIGLAAAGGYVVGLLKRVVLWDGANQYRTLAEIEPALPDNRLNEGQVAPDGSFWVGTMQNNMQPDGSPKPIAGAHGRLYRISQTGGIKPVTQNQFGITNTMIWLDTGRFVTADTMADALYDYEVVAGGLGARMRFAPSPGRGVPDGSTLDAAGFVWNCRVANGAALARFGPDGELDDLIDLPCASPTSCCFGGPDLATLFVTSARFGLSPEYLDAHPSEGGVFALRAGVTGRLARRFGGNRNIDSA